MMGQRPEAQDQLFYSFSLDDHVPSIDPELIDLDAGIIVDVEATPANRTQEVDSTKAMVNRVEQRFGMKPRRLVGDTAYGTAEMLSWMVNEKQIAPHVPVWDRTERRDGSLSASEFRWDQQSDEYRCPQGRKIARSVHEDARDVGRAIAKTLEYGQSKRQRKKVEMLFTHLRRILKLDRLRLRGLSGARDEFLLAATAQNLRRMAKRLMEVKQGTVMQRHEEGDGHQQGHHQCRDQVTQQTQRVAGRHAECAGHQPGHAV